MWSGPRNLSTALMYAFAARPDCAVSDEPFYAAYLHATGLDHPMRAAVIGSQPTDPAEVAAQCTGPNPDGKPIWYQKHMTMHMVAEFDRAFLPFLTNAFLIRHPARVIASYAKKREAATLQDLGFLQQAELFDQTADLSGTAPPVIAAEAIRQDPKGALTRLCAALHIPFTAAMLTWPAGPKPQDGIWAPHWYGAVHRSTGFEPPEGELPTLSPENQRLADQALPAYERLSRHAI
ncbi:MAG: sulfotransferase family protein [Rhodobacterales bacterium 32-66-7]|nr:MAG: sulfotransferase family protein [Rhodobacterales bacterium 12-65-15]OYX27170.1 MAG: sulfotransferase family protein [Rhodobacterales bacterium 32-66-7]